VIITLVFEKNANFFAENWGKSQKIVIITSTPGWRVKQIFFLLFSLHSFVAAPQLRTPPDQRIPGSNPGQGVKIKALLEWSAVVNILNEFSLCVFEKNNYLKNNDMNIQN
jgi:hypothetical protein